MSKFKVGDKVLFGNQVVEITQIFDSGKCMVSNGWLQNSAWIDDLESYKTPHQRLLDLGFVISDETVYHISYMLKELDITIFKKEKTYQAYSYQDNYNPINLELAEVLVDYLKELPLR